MTHSLPTVTAKGLHNRSGIDERSRNVLVNLSGTDTDHRLVHEAGTYATGTGGKLVLLSVMPLSEFADRQRAYAQVKALPPYALDQAEELRRQTATTIGREALDPIGIDYTAVGMVGNKVNEVLTTAQVYDCGHLFIAAEPPSLLQRLLTRDFAQSIVGRFDGFVTVLQDRYDKNPPLNGRSESSDMLSVMRNEH